MNREEIDKLLERGKKFFDEKKHNKALTLFNEVLQNDKNSTEAMYLMANVFHSRGEIGKAIKAFQKILSLNPNHTDASISLSVLYNDIGQYDDAKIIFEEADKRIKTRETPDHMMDEYINKKFSMKHFELAELYMTYERYNDALLEYNKSSVLAPTDLLVKLKIAQLYAKKGFLTKSFDELKKLKNKYPNYMPARVALGILYYGDGNILKAQSEWSKVRGLDPQNKDALTYLNLSKSATETKISY